MTEITEILPLGLNSKLKDNLSIVLTNPMLIQRTMLNHLEDMLGTDFELVDPTNPFIFLLEASSVNTASVINENKVLLRKQYPVLAQTEEDLYRHMTDLDYIGRFALPGKVDMKFTMHYKTFIENAIFVATDNLYKITIPRYTVVLVDDISFILLYPIDIIKYVNGGLQVTYDTTVISDIEALSTNIIEHVQYKDNNLEEWVTFSIPMKQLDISSIEYTITATGNVEETIEFNDKFHHASVYQKNINTGGEWEKIRTTHSDQVYDITVPTVLLKVVENRLTIKVPAVYLNINSLIEGVLRIDIYTTKGDISTNFSEVNINNFRSLAREVDPSNDTNVYTAASNLIPILPFTTDKITLGKNDIDFDVFRTKLIERTTGTLNNPITEKEITAGFDRLGYTFFKGIDLITERVFLAAKSLDIPDTTFIQIRSDSTTMSFSTNNISITGSSTVFTEGNTTVINSDTIFKEDNGVLSLMSDVEKQDILTSSPANRINKVNGIYSYYTPFYYMLDLSSTDIDIRTYHLDNPKVNIVNFKDKNSTIPMAANTKNINIEKTNTGYKLELSTTSNDTYKDVYNPGNPALHGVQIVIEIDNNVFIYMNNDGIPLLTTDNELLFTFNIDTNNLINTSDKIKVSNFFDNKGVVTNAFIPLELDIHVYFFTHVIDVNYTPSSLDDKINRNLTGMNTTDQILTEEVYKTTLGKKLELLFNKGRITYNENKYLKHTTNKKAYYQKDVFKIDPDTGTIFTFDNNIDCNVSTELIHRAGDLILDSLGNPTFEYEIGDIVYDANGLPIIDVGKGIDHIVELFLIEAEYIFADTIKHKEYKTEIANVYADRVLTDMVSLSNDVLENTEVNMSSITTSGYVSVISDDSTKTLRSRQTPSLTLYVRETLLNNKEVTDLITINAIRILNNQLRNKKISIEALKTIINDSLGDIVVAVKVSDLGDTDNIGYLTMSNDNERLSLKRKLVVDGDNLTHVEADINFNIIYI